MVRTFIILACLVSDPNNNLMAYIRATVFVSRACLTE